MAYVLVQHLDPRHESILAELLSEATRMAVAEVKGDVRVEPNRVYVIPPSKDIVLADGMLKLVPRSQTGGAHMPIDSFLRTLAEVQGSQGIGVILSGMASDGTLGLKAIKAEGGIAFAQDPRLGQERRTCRGARSPPAAWTSSCPPRRSRGSWRGWAAIPTSRRRAGPAAAAPVARRGTTTSDGLASDPPRCCGRPRGADFSAYKKTTLAGASRGAWP